MDTENAIGFFMENVLIHGSRNTAEIRPAAGAHWCAAEGVISSGVSVI
jgi:hypothetical protein